MNLQRRIITAAAGAAAIGLLSAGEAQAFTFTTDDYIVGDGTTVEFGFLESHGWFQSDFGVYNVTTGEYTTLFSEVDRNDKEILGPGNGGPDNQGTYGVTVKGSRFTNFTFEKNNQYSLFLNSEPDSPRVFSTTSLNQDKSWVTYGQQTKFFSDTSILDDGKWKSWSDEDLLSSDLAEADGSSATLLSGMKGLIAIEDNGFHGEGELAGQGIHRDFNDFLVTAEVVEVSVPEPATVIGLGLVAGVMAVSRRRKEGKVS